MIARLTARAAPLSRLAWLEERLGGAPFASDVKVIELVEGEGLRAVLAFDHWRHTSVRVSLAAVGPRAVRALPALLRDYAFRQAGRSILRTEIPSHSATALRLARHLGFAESHRVRDGHAAGDDLILFELRKE